MLREGLAASQAAHSDRNLKEMLHRCMDVLADINEQQEQVTQAMLIAWVKAGRPILEEPFAGEIFAQVVETGCRRGEVDVAVDSDRVGNLLRDAYLGALYRWTRKPDAAELHAAVDIVVSGIVRAPQSRPQSRFVI